MTSKSPEVHPVAALFPLIGEVDFAELVEHIKKHGQQQEIVLSSDGGTLIDGRNRLRACEAAKIEPRFRSLPKETTELDIINFIIGANMRRRDLSAGQRAMIALQIAPHLEGAAKERQIEAGRHGKEGGRGKRKTLAPTLGQGKAKRAGRADRQIAKASAIGHGTVAKARKVEGVSKRLADEVSAGTKSLDQAYKEARDAEKANPEKPRQASASKTHIVLRAYDGEKVEYKLPKSAASFNETNEQVSWAKWTWNPVTGCLHTCQFRYCYAKSIASSPKFKDAYPAGFKPLFHHERLDAPAHTQIPDRADRTDPRWKRVFVCSMADLYGKWVPDEWIDQVHASCIGNPQWEYLMLTKFPQRYVGLSLPPTAWIGTTVDEQKRVKIAEDAFRRIDGVRVRWLSLEPLLEPLEFTDLSMFDWIVIGSQSASDLPDVGHVPAFAPPFEWVARLTAQAHAAGCKIYQKPNLIGVPDPQHAGMKLIQEEPDLPPLPRMQRELFLAPAEKGEAA